MTFRRPDIADIATGAALRDWYWLKSELLAACRAQGVSTAGSKADLTDRLAHFLDTGARTSATQPRAISRFDWAREPLSRATVITDSYRNGPNVRAFFQAEIGPRFRFNIAFMDWMKVNCGKTLGDAVDVWLEIESRRKSGERSIIPPSNQYNRYARDFADDNPGARAADIRACWAAKRALPGHNRYERADLAALTAGCAPPRKPL